ncbi:MAG: sulfate transporter [Sphingobium sp. 66-54]|nr:MAG: sulfate transporter [Sphingobium sp. 66-54]
MDEAGTAPDTPPDGCRDIDGQRYWRNADGGLIPDGAVKPIDKLQDELVRKIIGFALPLSAQIARFRQHSFDDVDDFVALLEQEYGARRGGSKGNLTFTSYDGRLKIVVAVAEHILFGPELQVAKGLVDDCLREWSADSRTEIRAIINRAFDVDQQGQINRNDLLGLLRLEIADERWRKAMQAIRDSFRVIGSKRYIRFYQRPSGDARWEAISIDVAAG